MTRENINSRALDAISFLLSNSALHTKKSIANDLGISASKLSEILGERMNAGTDVLAGLSTEYNISPQWLLTGEGDMIDSEIPKSPDLILPKTDEFEYINNDNGGKIPLINELAFAVMDVDDPQKTRAEKYYYIEEFRNADFLMRMPGDSMAPKYKPGDLLACRNVGYDTYYQWGKVHALLTCHQGIIYGRVFEHHQNTILVRVKPENPSYPEWVIPQVEIAKVAIVVGSISLD